MAIYQLFVKLLDGRSQCLHLPSPTVSAETLKLHLCARTNIPASLIRIVTGCREIGDGTLVHASPEGFFPSVNLLLRLPGGKGGFGSLLRGAATKAGQKKTNNFDACRDMSGRRLRHVNAEKKIEEWVAEAEERRLEKIAEDFLKKKGKEVKKEKSVDVDKYLEKYREDSKKCMGEVEESVRQSFGLYKEAKRKVLPASEPSSKRLKIWLGKKKMEYSDSSDDSEDEDEERDRDGSVTEDDKLATEKKVEHDCSSASGSCGNSDGESSGVSSAGKQSGEGNENSLPVVDCPSMEPGCSDSNSESEGNMISEKGEPLDVAATDDVASLEEMPVIVEPAAQEEMQVQLNAAEKGLENITEVATVASINDTTIEEPLNFDKYDSAAELEVLGLERLKVELQSCGLKCGGTLQERASRLFLLKTTPVDKLSKKLLAKPSAAK